jgi:hypothetical protein
MLVRAVVVAYKPLLNSFLAFRAMAQSGLDG